MKNKIVNYLIKIINKNYKLSDTKIEEIRYGLESLYLLITKMIVILILSFILNITKELLLFILFYGILRALAFGVHAKNSIQCWILSLLTFISIPILIKNVSIPKMIIIPISILFLYILYKYAPASTEKRKLKNKEKRTLQKYITLFIAMSYICIMSFLPNIYLANILFYSIIIESLLILPITYKLLGVQYVYYKERRS